MNFYSDVLSRSMEADVTLPESAPPQTGYPVLFLLHGMTDDHTLWQRRTSIERYADEHRLAVVMPSTRLGWYANTCAGERYFDFISDELVHSMYRIFPRLSRRREDTFVAGLSMGGYGALRCGLTYPNIFSKVAALSGATDISTLVKNPNPLGKPFCWEDVFGTQAEITASANDLFHAAEIQTANRPEIYIWCGTEDSLCSMNRKMRDHLYRLNYSLFYHESAGDHTWECWDREIQNVLDWMLPESEDTICP